MLVMLRDDSVKNSFDFDPSRDWKKGKEGEYIIGHGTGLPEPFTKVFVKRYDRKPAAHDLLAKLVGKEVRGTPKVFSCAKEGRYYYYFLHNLPESYRLLAKQLTSTRLLTPEVVRTVVKRAANVFNRLSLYGFVYIDFCSKNIMIDADNGSVFIIDLDSGWQITRLAAECPSYSEASVDFWELWNRNISIVAPNRLGNAPKTVVLSFAAVWSRAVALAYHLKNPNPEVALSLVLSPNYDRQRALWEALAFQNRPGFLEYFKLSEASARPVYNQWQALFDDLCKGRELPWPELLSATEHLLAAIEEVQQPQIRRGRSDADAATVRVHPGHVALDPLPAKGPMRQPDLAAAQRSIPSPPPAPLLTQDQIEALHRGVKYFLNRLFKPPGAFWPWDK